MVTNLILDIIIDAHSSKWIRDKNQPILHFTSSFGTLQFVGGHFTAYPRAERRTADEVNATFSYVFLS